jgi:hypothetical protein
MGVLTAGRLVCDTYLAAREFLMKETTYTMSALAKAHFDYVRKEIDPLDVPRYLGGGASADAVLGIMEHTQIDAQLAIRAIVSPTFLFDEATLVLGVNGQIALVARV